MNPEVNTNEKGLAAYNREAIEPFINQVLERIYLEVDKAAEKGIALTNMSKDDASKCVAQILFNIQKNLVDNAYTERNIFECTAYYVGATVGYPMGAVSAILSKLPLASHFKAGYGAGEVTFQKHAFRIYMMMNAKKIQVQDYLTQKKDQVVASVTAPKETVPELEFRPA